ncbi:MAG: amino acid racemase [Candidatus Aenigmarchaeota archaeon]|nr:amino acid racemase [Candidatus Aenigmarchaeota archaeon]
MKVKIGVLGGIGPESTKDFYGRLITLIQERGVNSNADFPQIIINSIPAPELIGNEISEEELKMYIDGIKELDNFGVDFIVMVCNTIHLFHKRLQKEINTEILDLRYELKKRLIEKNLSIITVLGSPSTIKKLYKFEGIKSISIEEEETKQLSKAIFNFNRGFEKDKQIEKVKDISEEYLRKGSQIIVLGCTEFSLMLKDVDIPKVDTIELLAEITADRINKHKETN